jgi:Cdc6-like AAA superfamily ATPase
MRLPIPRRGLAADEVFDKILQYVKNYKRPILLILDEIDAIRGEELLYVVSRSNEKILVFGIIGISNSKSMLSKLDQRVKSSLRFSEMEFSEYGEDQLFSILNTRAEKALIPGSFDEKLLRKIARSVDDGSARVAIERLWKSAKHAEQQRKSKIMIQDFEDILSTSPGFKKQELYLSDEETFILEMLKEKPLHSTELYNLFSKKFDKSKRQIRNYLDSLEQKRLIKSSELESHGMMNSKVFKLIERE